MWFNVGKLEDDWPNSIVSQCFRGIILQRAGMIHVTHALQENLPVFRQQHA